MRLEERIKNANAHSWEGVPRGPHGPGECIEAVIAGAPGFDVAWLESGETALSQILLRTGYLRICHQHLPQFVGLWSRSGMKSIDTRP